MVSASSCSGGRYLFWLFAYTPCVQQLLPTGICCTSGLCYQHNPLVFFDHMWSRLCQYMNYASTDLFVAISINLQTTPHKLSFSPKESLPPGSSDTWLTWSSLNRLRTWTGRCKSLMQKWGFNEDGQTTCECGDEQTMKHLLVCPILPQPCTHEDLEEFNPELDPAPSIGRESCSDSKRRSDDICRSCLTVCTSVSFRSAA